MTKYVVTSQPRTAAKNNSTEASSSNKYYQQDEDNDQCCFVYFYSLYCSRCRCSGCCGDDKQKRRKPQRRSFDNYTSDPLYVDDINTLNFNDEVNTYEAYSDHNGVGGNEQERNILNHRDDFYEQYGGHSDDNNRDIDHCAGKPGGVHVSSHTNEDVNSIRFAHNGGEEYSTSVCFSDINYTGNIGHIGGPGGQDTCGGDTGGGDTGGGDTSGGGTGGGDTGGGDSCGGGDSGGGDAD